MHSGAASFSYQVNFLITYLIQVSKGNKEAKVGKLKQTLIQCEMGLNLASGSNLSKVYLLH